MPSSISTVAERFTAKLDELVVAEIKTGDLTLNKDLVGDFVGVGKVNVAKIALNGLADYDRSNGFPAGSVTLDWETLALAYDRGREFSIDVMDDEERELIVSANAMGEFVRTKVVPEIDAIRFARLFEACGSGNKAAANLTSSTVEDALLAGEAAVTQEADLDGCILYATQATKNLIRKALPYRIGQGEDPNGLFDTFDDMKVVTVPQARFYSRIELLDGTTSGQEDGGYICGTNHYALTEDTEVDSSKTYYTRSGSGTSASPYVYTEVASPVKANLGTYYEITQAAGKGLNFMIVNPLAAAAIQKHQTLRHFAPHVNQDADAHKWQYRIFHDLLVYDNKSTLVYAHTVA